MRAYGEDVLILGVTAILLLAISVAARVVVIELIRFGWLS